MHTSQNDNIVFRRETFETSSLNIKWEFCQVMMELSIVDKQCPKSNNNPTLEVGGSFLKDVAESIFVEAPHRLERMFC